MKSMSIVALTVVILHGSSSKSVPWTSASLLQKENEEQQISKEKEDEAGPYVLKMMDQHLIKKQGEIREFIWSHWQERRTGRLIATFYSKEGVPSETTFALQPDEHSVWSLKVTIQRPSLAGTTAEHTEYIAYSVRRMAPRHDGQSPAIFIPERDTRSPRTYRLVFYDAKGKETGGV